MTETDCRIEPLSSTFTAAAPKAASGPGPARRVVCWATVAAVLPYLGLKISWLSGSTVGLARPGLAESSTLSALNTLTLAMDSAAVLVALALTYRWGGACRPGWWSRRCGWRPDSSAPPSWSSRSSSAWTRRPAAPSAHRTDSSRPGSTWSSMAASCSRGSAC